MPGLASGLLRSMRTEGTQSSLLLPPARRIAVVGAGAVGLSCALLLRRAGLEVDLFDRGEPGEGASLGNAGIIAVSEVLPVGRPEIIAQVPRMILSADGPLRIRPAYLPAIAPWLMRMLVASRPANVDRLSRQLAALLQHAFAGWEDLVAGTEAQPLLRADGWLKLYTSESGLAAARAAVDVVHGLGVRAQMLDAAQVRDLEPNLAPVAGGVLFPDAGNVSSPLSMMQALAREAQRAGVRIYRRDIARLGGTPASPSLIDAHGTELRHDRVVIAAGAWSRRLLETIGQSVPLDTERGYHLMLPSPERTISRPVSLPNPGYTLVQMDGGVRMTTGVEFAGLDAPADFRRARRVVAHAAGMLPGLAQVPLGAWLGFRPSMPDSLPVIGPLAAHPGIVLAFGHGHLGITLGPLTGQLVRAYVLGREPPFDARALRPGRFGL